jgi:hypothetical protein
MRRFYLPILILGAFLFAGGGDHTMVTSAMDQKTRARITQELQRLPLYFIENRGQLDPRVAYYVQGKDKTLYFTEEGITYVLTEQGKNRPSILKASLGGKEESIAQRSWVVKLDFVGASVRPKGLDSRGATINYFKGKPGEWRTGLRTYGSLVYKDLWPGIDLVYSGTQDRLKYEFVVHPGADPGRIRLAYHGAEVSLTDGGRLDIGTPVASFQDDRPYAYQGIEGGRQEVSCSYRLGALDGEGQTYGYNIGPYDRTKPLVLDPAVLVYCGFIGGIGYDTAFGIAVDSSGNAYVCGFTESTESTFPVKTGPDLTHNGSDTDAFVAKVKADGTALVYCGYIGGNGDEKTTSIAVDQSGSAYVCGDTTSTQTTFPVSIGPDLTYSSSGDAFVAKVTADGKGLVYCGYIGGSGADYGQDIAVDSNGNAYVFGDTTSTQTNFPVAIGPDLTHNGGGTDTFVAKVNADGTTLVYCGFIGGNGYEKGYGIAVDQSGNAYVSGYTDSTEGTFPVITGPDLIQNGGGDGFVAKVNAAGTGLAYCGYIGGSSTEYAYDIAVDSTGNAYVCGYTFSTEVTFPANIGPDLTQNGGGDAFVAKVKADGTVLVYCGYIGGGDYDEACGIVVDQYDNAYVCGRTESDETDFPVKTGPDLAHNGGYDVFVAKVKVDGTGLIYCGYIGGSGNDYGQDIAVDSNGNAYVYGYTPSTEIDFPVKNGPDLTHNGGIYDPFVAKVHLTTHVPLDLLLLE